VPLRRTTAHHHQLWTVWTGIKDAHAIDYTSTERTSNQLLSEAFATSKTDRILDEYIKTVSPPIVGQTYGSYNTTSLSHEECLQKTMNLLKKDNIHNKYTPPRTTTVSTNSSPLLVQQQAKMQREHIRTMNNTVNSSWYPVTFKPVTDASSAYTVFPLRARKLQELSAFHGRNILCLPTVATPLHTATVVLETLELHLERLISADASVKSTDYRRLVAVSRRLLRRVVTRGGVIDEWIADLQDYEGDLGELTPNDDQLGRRQAYQYMTPTRILSSLLRNVDKLCTNTTELHFLMMLQETQYSKWWSVDHDKLYPSRMNLVWMHELAQHERESQSTEQVRQNTVRNTLHSKTNDETIVRQYAHRYEQLVRLQSMSNSAFRKDDEVLTIVHTIRNMPKPSTLKAIQKQPTHVHHQTTTKVTKSASTKTKTMRLTLNTKDRVPQEINVKVKKNNRKRPTTHTVHKMTTATSEQNACSTNLPPSSNDSKTKTKTNTKTKTKTKTNTKTNTQTNTKIKKNGGGHPKTITISTSSATSAENNIVDAINISTATKNKNIESHGGARYLTTDEVTAYREGLQEHIKQKGGGTFVQEQQQIQKKKNPGFHFDDIVDTKNTHYTNIKHKLQLSAKNRNALRRVKREILKSFGGHRTFKNIKKHKSCNNKTTVALQEDPHGFRGSLYTRKNAGGGTSANPPSFPSVARVTWKEHDSLGEKLRDTSTNDVGTTDGLSTIDLSGLEEVVID
jgi:hypothetical protein